MIWMENLIWPNLFCSRSDIIHQHDFNKIFVTIVFAKLNETDHVIPLKIVIAQPGYNYV